MYKFLGFLCLIIYGMKAFSSSMIEINGNSLEYEVKGSGEITVLFDAGALSGMAGWDSIWSNLPLGITAVRFSRLGEGNSSPCVGQRTKSDYVNEVNQLLSALNVKKPIVYVGHSLGGITARNFSSKYQKDVSAILMVDPANPRDVDIVVELDPKGGKGQIETVKNNDYAMGEGKWCFLDVLWDKSKAVGYPEIGDKMVTLIAAGKGSDESLNPIETIKGRKLWVSYQKEWVKQFPQGVFIKAANSGHFVQDDEPDLVLNELKKLLTRLKKLSL